MTKTESIKYCLYATDEKGKTRPLTLEVKTLDQAKKVLEEFSTSVYYTKHYTDIHIRKIVRSVSTTPVEV